MVFKRVFNRLQFALLRLRKESATVLHRNRKIFINRRLFEFKNSFIYLSHSCNIYLKIYYIFRTCSELCLLTQFCVSHLSLYRVQYRSLVMLFKKVEPKYSHNSNLSNHSFYFACLFLFCFFLFLIRSSEYHLTLSRVAAKNSNAFSSLRNLNISQKICIILAKIT